MNGTNENEAGKGVNEKAEPASSSTVAEGDVPTSSNEGVSSAKRPRQQRLLHLAVAGCSHGQMEKIYARMAEEERNRGIKFDLLICCGDYQATRNWGDLQYMHVPHYHRKLGTFYKYYSGEKMAPVLTLFIGGNHESSGFMAELPNGGWVAPNIYYMGYASVVQFAGLRIAGLSGIYKPNDYNRGHFERPPFGERGSQISTYHVRSVEIFRLRQLRDSPLDICFSHDWPAGVTNFGDQEGLLRKKPFFREDVMNGRLGNPATMNLIHELRPKYWFAAHMHVRFTAVVPHTEEVGTDTPVTRFLALDKPTDDEGRRFLEFMEIPIAEDAPLQLQYDPHWLSVLRATDELTEITDRTVYMPGEIAGSGVRHDFRPSTEELEAVVAQFGGDLCIPLNFQQTAPPETQPWGKNARGETPSLYYRNPQTQLFCERLGIRDLNLLFAQASPNHLGIPHFLEQNMNKAAAAADSANPDEIDLGDEFGDQDFIVDVPNVVCEESDVKSKETTE